MDHHACEELRESIEKVSLSLWLFNPVSVLWESGLEAVVDRLSKVVVELLEELVLVLLANLFWVIMQDVRHVVGSHSIKQELVVSQVGILLLVFLETRADKVPESI